MKQEIKLRDLNAELNIALSPIVEQMMPETCKQIIYREKLL